MASLYDERVLGAQQRAEFARKLRESSNQPAGQMVSGWYVPNTGGAVVDALKNVLGAYQEREANDELKGIEQERGRAMIDALAQGGMKVPQSMLTQYGQKAQEPSFIDKSIAFLRGQEAPKATPAQAYQPNVNVNATPSDKEAAMYQALMINPEGSAPFINLYTASENRKATQAEKEYNRAWEQQKFAAEQAARKENAQENRDFRREMAGIAAGNRPEKMLTYLDTATGQGVTVPQSQFPQGAQIWTPQASKNVIDQNQMVKGKESLQSTLFDLANEYKNLYNAGAIKSEQGEGLGNAIGVPYERLKGKAFGTNVETSLSNIGQARSALLQDFKNATGMSASQMNSDAELQNALKTLTDPNSTYEAAQDQANLLSRKYGTGQPIFPERLKFKQQAAQQQNLPNAQGWSIEEAK